MIKKKDEHNETVSFHAEKKSYTAPRISESFIDDDGVTQYILESGNTVPKDKYDSIWNPQKGKVLPLHTKASRIHGNGLWIPMIAILLWSCSTLRYNTYVHKSVVVSTTPFRTKPLSSPKKINLNVGDTIIVISMK